MSTQLGMETCNGNMSIHKLSISDGRFPRANPFAGRSRMKCPHPAWTCSREREAATRIRVCRWTWQRRLKVRSIVVAHTAIGLLSKRLGVEARVTRSRQHVGAWTRSHLLLGFRTSYSSFLAWTKKSLNPPLLLLLLSLFYRRESSGFVHVAGEAVP